MKQGYSIYVLGCWLSGAGWVAGCGGSGSGQDLFAASSGPGMGGTPGVGGSGGLGTGGTPGVGGSGGLGMGGTPGVGGSAGLGTGGTPGVGGSGGLGTGGTPGAGGMVSDPKTCAEAALHPSSLGCDFWPTVTANRVWSTFDFVVVVSNGGQEGANVVVTGPDGTYEKRIVQPRSLEKIYLPWVASLKGDDADECGALQTTPATVLARGGAFHLVSDRPVSVVQFNALEVKGEGGPTGKDWSTCPGFRSCSSSGTPAGCYSFTNDASLLLPSTAMTGVYRLGGIPGSDGTASTFAAITATRDGTEVEVRPTAPVLAGGPWPDGLKVGQAAKVVLNVGDVLQVAGGQGSKDDLSGSLVVANLPVQVITGSPCRSVPGDVSACDHLEETVPPSETLGKEYVVTVPAKPRSNGAESVPQVVRIVGNQDDTVLHFDPPISAPGIANGQATIDAGQVLDLGAVEANFVVRSEDKEFLVATFQMGGSAVDPSTLENPKSTGDPSQSFVFGVETYRSRHVFLAPPDYDVNFVNVVTMLGADVILDGDAIPSEWLLPIGSSGYGVVRLMLSPTGQHEVSANRPVGLQVYGYAQYTSYQYPAG